MTSTTKPLDLQLELQSEWQVESRSAPDGRLHGGQSYEELCGE